jgi:hypothetical protein
MKSDQAANGGTERAKRRTDEQTGLEPDAARRDTGRDSCGDATWCDFLGHEAPLDVTYRPVRELGAGPVVWR